MPPFGLLKSLLKQEGDSMDQLWLHKIRATILALEMNWGLKSSPPPSCYRCCEFHSPLSYYIPYPLLTFLFFAFFFLPSFPRILVLPFFFSPLGIIILLLLKNILPFRTWRACLNQHRWRKSLSFFGHFPTPYLPASDLSSFPETCFNLYFSL